VASTFDLGRTESMVEFVCECSDGHHASTGGADAVRVRARAGEPDPLSCSSTGTSTRSSTRWSPRTSASSPSRRSATPRRPRPSSTRGRERPPPAGESGAVRKRESQDPGDELAAAWAALTERERRSQEVLRRRLKDFEERSARLNGLTQELEERDWRGSPARRPRWWRPAAASAGARGGDRPPRAGRARRRGAGGGQRGPVGRARCAGRRAGGADRGAGGAQAPGSARPRTR